MTTQADTNRRGATVARQALAVARDPQPGDPRDMTETYIALLDLGVAPELRVTHGSDAPSPIFDELDRERRTGRDRHGRFVRWAS